MFTQSFDAIVCDGDRIVCKVDGFTCIARLYFDEDTAPEKTIPHYDAWLRDEWHYFGVAVTVWRDGAQLTEDYHHSINGIEGNYPGGDNSYFREVSNDLLIHALTDARTRIAKWAREVAS